jgi:hypothetical protein
LHVHIEEPMSNLLDFHKETKPVGNKGFYGSLAELLNTNLPMREEILCGLHRGEVGQLAAVTNYGKSTLLLNVCLSLASGQECYPLLPTSNTPRRVIYVDCESPAVMLRDDLSIMMERIENEEAAQKNFIPLVDVEIRDLALDLSNDSHMRLLAARGKEVQVDLIVVDTITSGFDLSRENDNSEITKRALKPLKKLAMDLNCAVVFAHHIGKMSESSRVGAYLGRGGSAFGGMSRAIYSLEKDAKHGEGYVVLTAQKSKTTNTFDPVLLKLNRESRWFELCGEKPEPKREFVLTTLDIVTILAEKSLTTSELCEYFSHLCSKRTVMDRISEAQAIGLIEKQTLRAAWHIITPVIDPDKDSNAVTEVRN